MKKTKKRSLIEVLRAGLSKKTPKRYLTSLMEALPAENFTKKVSYKKFTKMTNVGRFPKPGFPDKILLVYKKMVVYEIEGDIPWAKE
ncbi:hypothetical protein QNH20_25665 [Neobacillus sp. WH10]|uniref:hypothetical protein n=1 Tax=Neobacillus sp. WH10 TaxID=3047873 RepID=UPI0024C2098B|nr:hypothetical protein [Neobacillus sp. WH10]WHY77407.1 hypothetical protein QNH20_25665 [Neobacillus sp. WH10]